MAPIHWEVTVFGPKPAQGGREQQTPRGIVRIVPKPPLPRRVSYLATVAAGDWNSVTETLIQYWVKVAEILPEFYGGRTSADPLMNEPPEVVAPDSGWDRIVCLLNVAYGKFTTNLWAGSQQPRHCDRVWIIAKFPMIEGAFAEASEDELEVQSNLLAQRMHTALADAADCEPAKTALNRLRDWRDFSLWVMQEEEPETLRPLVYAATK